MPKQTLLDRLAELTGKGAAPAEPKPQAVPRRKFRRTYPAGTHRGWSQPAHCRGPRKPPGASILDKCVAAMEPGCWYAGVDIRALAGLTELQWRGTSKSRYRHGWLTRRHNPEWAPRKTAAEVSRPLWLYTLTPEGEARRRLLLAHIAEAVEQRQEGQ